ncbi:cytochrome o ubiquinol oxidase subunit IV [Paracoccus sediminis]|uniref:Cytochrome bo(3) ubiquinol oxidase subunit 4 n=1 Tax=Paracoccus sediminis TaxID=1214787 RepID=A0A238W159_9RHOB|nr:cytochrome o ubiquinol oxidase subunit IV [Paracoccus sediminis]TBN51481.1 cytochrome o ubiquinol oxidase subunit IV [Paracoccus sediminis]SNR40228.1 cytochrome ba3 quinol oxidase subunit 4 [Paracoccus sediminis]
MTSIEAQGDKHRAERRAEAHADRHDDGHDHGSFKSCMTGFVLSVILTAIPFAVVMGGGFESRLLTVAVVVGLGIVQIVVHMIFFLHMNTRSDEGWTMMALIFTVVVVIIMLAGSLWVMFHLNTNMMPQMNHEALGLDS